MFAEILGTPFIQKFNKWVKRRHPSTVGSLYLNARNIYILPTKTGVGFGVLLALLLVGSINYANNLGYLLTFWLCGLFVIAILITYRNMIGMTVTVAPGEPVFCGEAVKFDVHLSSSDRIAKSEIVVEHQDFYAVVESIEPKQQGTAVIVVDTQRRGFIKIDRIKVYSSSPFGLFKAWTYANLRASILVYPKPQICTFPGLADAAANSVEAHRSSQQDGDQYDQLKKYQVGEPVSRIAWKLVARKKGWHTKQFTQSALPEMILDWDQMQGDIESKLSQLAYLVCECGKTHTKFGLKLPDQQIDPNDGKAHLAKCLELLALYGLQRT